MTLELTASGQELFRKYNTDGVPSSDLHSPDLDELQQWAVEMEAMIGLGFGVSVVTRQLSTPPGAPAEGAIYIVGASPSGDWSTFSEDDLAQWDGSTWSNRTPEEGNRVHLQDEEASAVYLSGSWTSGGQAGAGAKSGSGVTVVELGNEALHKTVLTLTAVNIALTDHTTNGGHGSLKVYDFPEGIIGRRGATFNLTIARVGTGLAATAAVVASLGSAAVGTGDATLTGTEADFIASTAATLSGGSGSAKSYGDANNTSLDGHATAVDLYLNFAVPDAGISASDTLTVDGTITLLWSNAGDYS